MKDKKELKQIKYFDNSSDGFVADKMLPCPFCGNDPEILFIGNNYTKSRKVTIKCKKCRVQRTDAALRFDHEWVARNAIEQWNERT